MNNQAKVSLENATARPWKVNVANGHPTQDGIDDRKGNWIGYANKADAALIVRAVNAYDALVESLKELMVAINANIEGDSIPLQYIAEELEHAENALKLAKGA